MNHNISSYLYEKIDLYLEGKLSPNEVDTLWEELLEQPEYFYVLKTRAVMKSISTEKEATSDRASEKEIKPVAPVLFGSRKTALTIAAILLLAAFLRVYFTLQGTSSYSVKETIPLVNIISHDVSRASTESLDEKSSELNAAFYQSLSGNTEIALNTYQELLDAGMNRDTLLFNMGILYYNNKNYQKASESFSAVDCTVFSPQQSIASCYWYSAISSYQAANIASAVSYTEKTISVDSRYKTDAKRFLQYLSGLDKS